MKKERILSYGLSEKLSEEDVNSISGASGWTQTWTANATGGPGHWDGAVDVTFDF